MYNIYLSNKIGSAFFQVSVIYIKADTIDAGFLTFYQDIYLHNIFYSYYKSI